MQTEKNPKLEQVEVEQKFDPLIEHKYNLITRGLEEVIDPHGDIKKILATRDLKVYWGTAPTGRIHIGYLYPMLKISDLLDAGCHITILIADLHAFLDNMKSPLEKINARTEYYKETIKGIFDALQVDYTNLKFVIGSSFQLKQEYVMDIFKLGNITSVGEAKHAGADIVKKSGDPLLTSLLYPLLQSLDEHYLDIDMELGGVDQRHNFMYSREFLPLVGYKNKNKTIYLMNPIIPGLSSVATGGQTVKMSSSDPNGKLDLLDTPKEIDKKIGSAYCLPGDIIDNTPLALTKNLIFPVLKRLNKTFIINRKEKFGGKLEYVDYATVESEFASKKLHPGDLKLGIADFLKQITQPVKNKFTDTKMQNLLKLAYD